MAVLIGGVFIRAELIGAELVEFLGFELVAQPAHSHQLGRP